MLRTCREILAVGVQAVPVGAIMGFVKRFLPVLVVLAVLVLCFTLLPRLLLFLYPCAKEHFYDGLFGYALGAVFAAFLVWVAWQQLAGLGETSAADFVHRLNKDFFNARTRTIIDLLDADALVFLDSKDQDCKGKEGWPYFRVDKARVSQTTYPDDHVKRITGRNSYSSWEVDEILLSHFEDIGNLQKRGTISFSQVIDNFGWYITLAWDHPQIQAYLKYQRDYYSVDMWPAFERIAKKCKEYESRHTG